MLYERHLFFASFDILYKCTWTKVVDIIVYLLPNTTARITIALRFEIRIETKIARITIALRFEIRIETKIARITIALRF